jgi:hypothetical protein
MISWLSNVKCFLGSLLNDDMSLWRRMYNVDDK